MGPKLLLLLLSMLLTSIMSFTLQTNFTIPKMSPQIMHMQVLFTGNVVIWCSDQKVKEYDSTLTTKISQWDVHKSLNDNSFSITQIFKAFAISPSKQIYVGCVYENSSLQLVCCAANYVNLTDTCFGDNYTVALADFNISVAFLQNEQIVVVALYDKLFQFNCTSGLKLNQTQIILQLIPNSIVRTPYQILAVSRFFNIISISILNGISNITMKYVANTIENNYQIFYDEQNNYTIIFNTAQNNITLMQNVIPGNMIIINSTIVNCNTSELASCYVEDGMIYFTAGVILIQLAIINTSVVDSFTLAITAPAYMLQRKIGNGTFSPLVYWKDGKYIEIYQSTPVVLVIPPVPTPTPSVIVCRDNSSNCVVCDLQVTGYCQECSGDLMLIVNGICQDIQTKKIIEATVTTIGSVLSVPNLRLFLKPFGIFFQNLQDYWFYIYHDRNYSISLSIVFDSIKFINQQKMVPKFLRYLEVDKTLTVDKYYHSEYLPVTAKSYYAQEGIDLNFLNNTNQMYTINYLSSFITVLLTRLIYWVLYQIKCCRQTKPVINFFRQSGLYKQVLVAFLEANLIYISFYSFMQIKQPSYYDFRTKINMIIAICFLFAAIIYGVCFYFMVHALCSKRDAGVFLILKKNVFSGFLCQTLITGFRCLFNGFCHGYLLNNYILQICLLALCKLLVIVILFKLLKSFQKIVFGVFLLIYYFSGLILDMSLLIQYLLNQQNLPLVIVEGVLLVVMTGVIISFLLFSMIMPCIDGIKSMKKMFTASITPQTIEQTKQENKQDSKKLAKKKKQIHVKGDGKPLPKLVPDYKRQLQQKHDENKQIKIRTPKIRPNQLVVLQTNNKKNQSKFSEIE